MNTLEIGTVVRVASGRVEVHITSQVLDLVHENRSYRIGQLGSYVTIPMDSRTLVGFITSVGRTDSATSGSEPVLVAQTQLLGEIAGGRFTRGVNEYPIIGDAVWVAIQKDFEVIFGTFEELLAGSSHPQSFCLGRFAYNRSFEVKILGSEFFAKHVGILGNSGSGKSCTTAKILQEVLDLDQSQVVVFDMHGEYRTAFSDDEGQIDANVTYLGVDDLVLPYWLLKYEELEALFVDRSNPMNTSTQISFLRTALLEFKQDAANALGLSKVLTLDTPIYFALEKLKIYCENLNDARYILNDDRLAFAQLAMRSLTPLEQGKLMRTQRCQFNRGNPEGETPHPFYFGKLLGLIDQVDTKFNDRRYEFLLKPIEHGLKSRYFRDYIKDVEGTDQTSNLMNHLIKLLTGRVEPRSNLTIIDLSGIPFEIVDITVAVLTRLIFELNFWTPAEQRHPTLLVFEEAHNYVPRVEKGQQFAKAAVERVAKEGRKYGVSAMIVSQRPAELSETVLAQCNSFVVMRISNPDDQHYVSRVVGDHFAGVIDMLPVLRPGEAFVIGDSVLMPMRILVTLPCPTPQSADMDFFKHWTSGDGLENNLDQVIDHWRRQNRERTGDIGDQAVPEQLPEKKAEEPEKPKPKGPPKIPSMVGRRWLAN